MVNHENNSEVIVMNSPLVKNATMKALVGPNEGWDSHVLRVLTLDVNGYSPLHKHPWPHINYVLEGEGEIEIDGVITKVFEGSYAFIEGNKLHQFRNTGNTPFRFICIVPKEGHII